MSSHLGQDHDSWKDRLKSYLNAMIPDELMDTLLDFANTFIDDHVYDDEQVLVSS